MDVQFVVNFYHFLWGTMVDLNVGAEKYQASILILMVKYIGFDTNMVE